MRKKIIIGFVIILAVAAGLATWLLQLPTSQSQVVATDLAATITATDATQPKLHLKNISNHACQVATTSQGTVAITKLMQRGKVIQPQAVDSANSDDVGYLLKDQLKTLKPGEAQDINLPVYKLSAGYVLHTTTWSEGAGSLTSEYIITGTDPLQMDLGYSLPITTTGDVPACAAVFASTTSETPPALWLTIGGAVLAVVLAVGGLWLWRNKHKHGAKIKVAVFVLGAIGLSWCGVRVALADVVVPPELQADYDSCIGIFNANRDITGPVLDVLNNPANHFEIVHTHGVGSDMTGRRNGTGTGGIFTIYWNPDDHHQYAGTGGFPDKCTVLYHELYHALDQLRGTFSRDYCAGSGIETKEVMATRAQNELRVRLGLPPRSHYGDRPLPSGDCRAAPRPTSCTGAHCAESNGDPHLFTFDGLRYDFQAAGEFIAARNQSGSFEIQVRQEPWLHSRLVAINTAAAFKIGSDKIEIRAGQHLSLLVNGKTKTESSVTVNGGKVDLVDDVATVTWLDGSVAYVQSVGTYGVALSVQPSAELVASKLEGLLGDADGDSKNDLHTRGSATSLQPKFDQLYPTFADSWRIKNDASLFTYAAGRFTDSYTLRGFPEKPVDAKSLPGYAAAEAICKSYGVADPAVLANCALDVALTGRPEFARAASRSQAFTVGLVSGAATWQFNIKNPGDTASATFEGKANEKVFVQVLQSSLPSQCGTLRLLGPDKTELANGCIINGVGEIDGTVLPADGTYTVELNPGGSTGSAAVRLLHITDKQGSITPDGGGVSVAIDQPGVVGRYTFTGRSGQYAYVDFPTSTLDSQCGILRLLGPDGHELANGCIINHVGYIDTTLLPADGQYTIVIDPNDTTIGQSQMHLVFSTTETKPISIDGSTVSVALKKPGSFATLTFNGAQGQRVFVDVPTSELPSQCGLLVLRAPDGGELASGCVINNKGNINDDGIVLPATGRYTITLNPGAGDTGTTTIRLRSH